MQGGPWRALCCPGLEQPEYAVLDGELEVLGVAEHRLKGATQALEAVGEAWDGLGKTSEARARWRPATTSSPWASTRSQVEAVRPVAGTRVNPPARGGAEAGEDDGLIRHRRADEVLETLQAAVVDTRRPPGAEHRLDGSMSCSKGSPGKGRRFRAGRS